MHRRSLLVPVAILALVACRNPAPTTPVPSSEQTVRAKKATVAIQGVVRAPAGLIGNDGATLIGNDGATLVGLDGTTLLGTDGASLIGNDGATLVGNDGATLVGNDGATLAGKGGASLARNDATSLARNDATSLVRNAAPTLRQRQLFAADAPLAGAMVYLAFADGTPVKPLLKARTNAEGRFAFDTVPAGRYLAIAFANTASKKLARIAALADASADEPTLELTPASTVVAAAATVGRKGTLASFDKASYARVVAQVATALASGPAPDLGDRRALALGIRDLGKQVPELLKLPATVTVEAGPTETSPTTAPPQASATPTTGPVVPGLPAVTLSDLAPLAAMAGTSVTVSGENFSRLKDDNVVMFGAAKATVIEALPTKLIVKVPDGATDGPVSVTVNGVRAQTPKPFDAVGLRQFSTGAGLGPRRLAFEGLKTCWVACSASPLIMGIDRATGAVTPRSVPGLPSDVAISPKGALCVGFSDQKEFTRFGVDGLPLPAIPVEEFTLFFAFDMDGFAWNASAESLRVYTVPVLPTAARLDEPFTEIVGMAAARTAPVGMWVLGRNLKDVERSLELVTQTTSKPLRAAVPGDPTGLAIDPDGVPWVACPSLNLVRKLGADGRETASFPIQGGPSQLTFDARGRVWVACSGTGEIARLSADRKVVDRFRVLPAANTGLDAISVDAEGDVWAASGVNSLVVRITP